MVSYLRIQGHVKLFITNKFAKFPIQKYCITGYE